MKNKLLLFGFCGLIAACAISGRLHIQKNMYAENCTKTENYGKIDAYEVINMRNQTTFEAAEYINCADGRDLLDITWEGTHNKTNANLAAQIVAKFFTHFHAGEDIRFLLVPDESAKNVLVYKFETVVNNAI